MENIGIDLLENLILNPRTKEKDLKKLEDLKTKLEKSLVYNTKFNAVVPISRYISVCDSRKDFLALYDYLEGKGFNSQTAKLVDKYRKKYIPGEHFSLQDADGKSSS